MDIEPTLPFSFVQNSFIMTYYGLFRSFDPTHIEPDKSNKSEIDFLSKPCNLDYKRKFGATRAIVKLTTKLTQ